MPLTHWTSFAFARASDPHPGGPLSPGPPTTDIVLAKLCGSNTTKGCFAPSSSCRPAYFPRGTHDQTSRGTHDQIVHSSSPLYSPLLHHSTRYRSPALSGHVMQCKLSKLRHWVDVVVSPLSTPLDVHSTSLTIQRMIAGIEQRDISLRSSLQRTIQSYFFTAPQRQFPATEFSRFIRSQ